MEKLTCSVTFKCTPELKHEIEGLALMQDIAWSEWVRNAVMAAVSVERRKHEHLSKVFGRATDTAVTASNAQ